MSRATLTCTAFAFSCLLAPAVSGQRTEVADEEYLPPGPAKTLVAERCSACHGLGMFVGRRESKTDWETTVMTMADNGASLGPGEEQQITEYLSTVFGLDAPPLTDVNLATENELVKLPGITPELAARLIAHRTEPMSSRDEVQAAIGLNNDAFDKIRWYVRAVAQTK